MSLYGCSSKAQPLLLTLDMGYLLLAAAPGLGHGVSPLNKINSEFFFSGHRSKKTMRENIQSAERKRLSTKNSISSKAIFQNEGEIRTFPDKK